MSSWVENWRRPVGLLLNFPLPIFNEQFNYTRTILESNFGSSFYFAFLQERKLVIPFTNSVVTMQVYSYNHSFTIFIQIFNIN